MLYNPLILLMQMDSFDKLPRVLVTGQFSSFRVNTSFPHTLFAKGEINLWSLYCMPLDWLMGTEALKNPFHLCASQQI